MNINPLPYPTLLLAGVLFHLGRAVQPRVRSRRAAALCLTLGLLAATPGALYALYYLHWFDRAGWFYQLRSLPYTELLAAGLGFFAGYLHRWLWRSGGALRWLGPALVLGACVLLVVPYLKSLLTPLDTAGMADRWRDGVCQQTTPATCGPSCAVTLLRGRGLRVTEAELARECYTSATGTENWYLARALRRRGLRARFVLLPRNPKRLPYPAVAGLGLDPAGGHFVTVLGREGEGYVIGDPIGGRSVLTPEQVRARGFTGFFLVVE